MLKRIRLAAQENSDKGSSRLRQLVDHMDSI
jgi:hypothetical protein